MTDTSWECELCCCADRSYGMGGICLKCWDRVRLVGSALPLIVHTGASSGMRTLAVDDLIRRSHLGYGYCAGEVWQ